VCVCVVGGGEGGTVSFAAFVFCRVSAFALV
jgi:hypothetical protein